MRNALQEALFTYTGRLLNTFYAMYNAGKHLCPFLINWQNLNRQLTVRELQCGK
jgi:hypothetical protein